MPPEHHDGRGPDGLGLLLNDGLDVDQRPKTSIIGEIEGYLLLAGAQALRIELSLLEVRKECFAYSGGIAVGTRIYHGHSEKC